MSRVSPYLLAGLLAGAGVTHFVAPDFYDKLVPEVLPGSQRAWTYGSGVVELAVAGAIANAPTRKRGALAAAVLFVAVFPGNIKMALDAEGTQERFLSYARLPLQAPLVLWAWRVRRASAR
ncbi:MAG TPA: MauE/DoxX family redox-associated membrane protein [Mycobacteriales bacterium]|nr:MauE/DoxX family redox-associated membrane protein [Mycobacteriales bacterium]